MCIRVHSKSPSAGTDKWLDTCGYMERFNDWVVDHSLSESHDLRIGSSWQPWGGTRSSWICVLCHLCPALQVLVVATTLNGFTDRQIYLSIHRSTSWPLDLHSSTYPPIQLSAYACLSICVYLSVRPSARLAVYLSLSIAISGSLSLFLCAL